jgi:hypothetical protein
MSIDSQTGCDDQYDEALKFCINEIIEEIHRVKELDSYAVSDVYELIFKQKVESRYQEYLDSLKV